MVLREFGVDRSVGAGRVFDRGWCAFAGCLVSLTPIYKSGAVTLAMTIVFFTCASLVTAMYSQTTDFEKACAKEGQRRYVGGSDERKILDAFEDEVMRG